MQMHISKDGKPRECRAQPGACQLIHGSSPEEAVKNYEKAMSEYTFVKAQKKNIANAAPAPLKDVPDATVNAAVAVHVDRDDGWDEYYSATDAKHFTNKNAPGSKFTDRNLHKIEDVVALTMRQRGNLDGDDRDKLIARGASPDAFNPNNRYLMVQTPGTLGVKSSKNMRDDDLVEVRRTKPGTPATLVRKVVQQESTDYGVVVVSKDFDTGNPRVITTFPGTVTKPIKDNRLEALEGKTITVAQAKAILGGDFDANTQLVTPDELLEKTAPPAKPDPKFGFDTTRLSPNQVKVVRQKAQKMLDKVEHEYAGKLATATPDQQWQIQREQSSAVAAVYQKLSKF